MRFLVPATHVVAFTSFARTTKKNARQTALLLFSVAVLLAGGAAAVRGQSGLITFDPNANLPVLAIAVQPDGKIILGGNFTTLSPNFGATVTRNKLARLNLDGTLDTVFDPNVTGGDVNAIALQADGKIVIGGFFTNVGGQIRNRLARLNTDGTLDMAFDPNANNAVRSLAIQGDGKIIAGGQFTTLSPNGGAAVTRNRIARLNSDGTLDTAFNPNANNTVFAIVVQADGRILVGGFFNGLNSIGGASRNRIARLNSDGTADMGFDPNASNAVFALAVQPDGKVLAGGDFTTMGLAVRNRLARLDASTGAADSFDPNANLGVFTIALQADGKFVVGGDFTTMGSQSRRCVARFDPAGALDAFDPSANIGASVFAVRVQADGNVLVGGNFSSIAGQPRSHIARVGSDGTIPYLVNTTSDSVVANACARGLANCSLRGAIEAGNASSDPNAISFVIPTNGAGCVDSVCTINLTQVLPDMSTPFSIFGPGADKLIVRHTPGGQSFRVFNVTTNGTVNLSDFTMSNGSTGDLASHGGNINNASTGIVNVDRCTVKNGFVFGSGGGIANIGGGRVNVTGSLIDTNGAVGGGGGIANSNLGIVTVSDSTFTGNQTSAAQGQAPFGGAILSFSGTSNITNCTISGNTANGPGGGIAGADTLNITNCTIIGNSATGSGLTGGNLGGGIYSAGGTLNVKSCIIAGNTATDAGPDVNGSFNSAGFNLIGKTDASTGFTAATDLTGTSASPLDPELDPNGLQDNGGLTKTVLLLAGSPAIDQGTSDGLTGSLAEDQRGSGFSRTADDPAVTNAVGGDGTDIGAFEVQAAPTPTPTTFGNISTRLRVETGDNVLIGGLIITGTQPKKVIVRAIGPSLPLAGVLADPTLELHDGAGILIASNDNWMDAPNKQEIIDSTIPPSNDLESAILTTLDPGLYTGIVRGVNDTTGIGLVEAYDLDNTVDSNLANISTRGLVQIGDNVMIGGFILVGTDGQKVIVRAIGPSLGDFGVADPLADPTLELHDVNGVLVATNDDWRNDQEAEIMATNLAPTNDAESAIVQTLAPSLYTAIVRGKNNTIGVALVEVYNLGP